MFIIHGKIFVHRRYSFHHSINKQFVVSIQWFNPKVKTIYFCLISIFFIYFCKQKYSLFNMISNKMIFSIYRLYTCTFHVNVRHQMFNIDIDENV